MLSCASLKGIITLSHVLQLSVRCPQEMSVPLDCCVPDTVVVPFHFNSIIVWCLACYSPFSRFTSAVCCLQQFERQGIFP